MISTQRSKDIVRCWVEHVLSTETLKDVAAATGISTKSLQNYRDGRGVPSADKVLRIAAYLNEDMPSVHQDF